LENDLDDAERPEPGEDAVELRVRTSYGDIRIGRASTGVNGKDEA
jgi:hypothetical protein